MEKTGRYWGVVRVWLIGMGLFGGYGLDGPAQVRAETTAIVIAEDEPDEAFEKRDPVGAAILRCIKASNYQPPQALVEAMEAYRRIPRDRAEATRLFEKFIEEEPDSELLGHAYFQLGAMYSVNLGTDANAPGDLPDRAVAKRYFRKALQYYGDQVCSESMIIRDYLALSDAEPGHEGRKAYYAWLVHKYATLSEDDIYPIRSLGAIVKGVPPRLLDVEKPSIVSHFKEVSASDIASTEFGIFMASTPAERQDLIRSFPGTTLAIRTQRALEKVAQRRIDEMTVEAIEAGFFDEAATSPSPAVPRVDAATDTSGLLGQEAGPHDGNALGEGQDAVAPMGTTNSARGSSRVVSWLLLVLVVVAVGLVWARRSRGKDTVS